MSTDYHLVLTTPEGTTAKITINYSLNPLPGSDTWTADSEAQLGIKGGKVSSWGKTEADLSGPVGAKSVVLEGFQKKTAAGDSGSGEKNYDDGEFPLGSFTWKCDSIT